MHGYGGVWFRTSTEFEPRFSSQQIAPPDDVLTRKWIIPILDGFDEISESSVIISSSTIAPALLFTAARS